ncbi:MAG: hypothetical protein WC410_00920 [Candidatus Paceibacterota bacterium]|jgi:Co/Zn/Cd efflux system component|nr:hypothetical protein [Candidatus Paceibacterota bacterium]MDD5555172.1 hypothetical protein [Candidatus Paceibacterota bacterium]
MQDILSIFTENAILNLPNLIWAFLVFLVGVLVANKIKEGAAELLKKLRLNQMLKSLGWEEFFTRYNTQINISGFFSELVNVFFILLFLTISFDILGLEQFNAFIQKIIDYFPNIFIAIIIFIFTVFLADFSKKILLASMENEKIAYSSILGDIISSVAWILAGLAILYQLKIVPDLILTIFIGFVAFIVLVFGLAFGLGGKDFAKKILDGLEKKIK